MWVADLLISDRTATKITGRHGVTPDEVTQAVVCVERLQYTWHLDEERGARVLVSTAIRGRACIVVLYDAGHVLEDVWRLGSVYFVDR